MQQTTLLRTTEANLLGAWPWLLATALSIAVLAPTWISLATQWLQWEQVLSHGLPTFLLFLGLLIFHPPLISPTPAWSQWPIVAGAALIVMIIVWGLLELVNIDLLAYLMLPVSMAAFAWLLFGFQAMVRFLPYLLILSLSLPFWGDLIPLLVSLASTVVGAIVHRMGMTALIEGSSITLPWGRLLIEDGCSGIRYFAISILLAATIATLNDYRLRGWLITVSIAVILALLVNWIRITGLVVIGYQTEMQSSLMTDHELYGWLIFAAVCLPALYLAPSKRRTAITHQPTARLNTKGLLFVAVAVVLGPVALMATGNTIPQRPPWTLSQHEPTSLVQSLQPIPLQIPATLTTTNYRVGDHQVWVQVAQFQRTDASEKLVPYLGRLIDNTRWQRLRSTNSSESVHPVHVFRDTTTQRQVAQMQWFRVGEFETADYRIAKLMQIPSTLMRENRFALVTLQLPCRASDCSQEARWLNEAAAQLSWEAISP